MIEQVARMEAPRRRLEACNRRDAADVGPKLVNVFSDRQCGRHLLRSLPDSPGGGHVLLLKPT